MKALFIFLSIGFIASCSQFEPFEDRHREAGEVQMQGKSTDNNPVICYNPIWHDEAQINALANEACKRTHRKAEFKEKKSFSCRFVNPSAMIYQCK